VIEFNDLARAGVESWVPGLPDRASQPDCAGGQIAYFVFHGNELRRGTTGHRKCNNKNGNEVSVHCSASWDNCAKVNVTGPFFSLNVYRMVQILYISF